MPHQILLQIAVQDIGDGFAVLQGFDRKVRIAVACALCRTIEDLPVQQSAVSAKSDGAGPDSAERKGDLFGVTSLLFHDSYLI